MPRKTSDKRYLFGANCCWHGRISDVGKIQSPTGHSIPCCPHCGGMLQEYSSKEQWDEDASAYEKSGNPGYTEFLIWIAEQPKCYPTYTLARGAYDAANRD